MISTDGKTVIEVVSEVLRAIIDQGGRCIDRYNDCMYGDGKGKHCAVGWLMPDDRKDLMGLMGNLDTLIAEEDDLGPNTGFILKNRTLLYILQTFHDSDHLNMYEKDLAGQVGDLPEMKEWRLLREKQQNEG